jgi:hypothetical protein
METIPSTINPRLEEPILHQALKMALDDEFHAREAYIRVIETLGAKTPFTTIAASEQNHQEELIKLFEKYQVPIIENRWIGVIEVPKTLHEAYAMGVNAEIANIQLYDTLLAYTGNFPDVQDVFYRLQAASYNHHLPAFQAHLAPAEAKASATQNAEASLVSIREMSALVGKFSKGEMAPEDVMKLLSGTNASFLIGALVGALGAGVMSRVMQEQKSAEKEEE